MSTLAMLNIVALGISMMIAASLILVVLGYGPKRALNRSFALFALGLAASSFLDTLVHMILLQEDGNPFLVMELSYLFQVVMGPFLLMFTVRYLDRRTRRVDLATGLGLAAIAVLCIPLFRHQLAHPPYMDANGMPSIDYNSWGVMGVQMATVYNVWSLVLFWKERRRIGEPYLPWGVFVMQAGYILEGVFQPVFPITSVTTALGVSILGYGIVSRQLFNPLHELTKELELKVQERTQELERAYTEVEKKVEERTAELQQEVAERERAQEKSSRLQQQIIDAQRQAIQELSTPVIPIMERIIVLPLVGSIDSMRARDITRALLAGIRKHRAKVVILDVTGVSIVDSDVANHLNKTIQAARLKGAHTIVTGISDEVAETIVDLGIDWEGIDTVNNLQTGLQVALERTGRRLA